MMRRNLTISIILFAAMAAVEPSYLNATGIKGREIFGLRLGGIHTTGNLRENFGKGSEIELHFVEGLGSWFGVGFAFSSHNLGESKNRDKDIDFTGSDRRLDLQIYSATASFFTITTLTKRLRATTEAGLGIYSINGIVQSGFFEGYITDNQFGLYGGFGLVFRLTKRLSLDANTKFHYVFSGGDSTHIIYFYTENNRTMLYQMSLGIMIYTD